MTTRTDLEHAAELLQWLLPQTTPAPWRDNSVDGAEYRGLVSATCSRACDEWWANYQARREPKWAGRHPHDGYGGCLVAETMQAPDRRLLATLRNLADEIPRLLEAVAAEDPQAVGHVARGIAAAVLETHRPTPNASPTSDTIPPERVTPP